MSKSADAFRTISEVSAWLGVPAHVLRFWETRFPQVKPVKRAGGRRYYRPADMELLGGIRKLLHDDGLTIRGVQKILREKGIRHVSQLSPPVATEPAANPGDDAAPRRARAKPAPRATGAKVAPASAHAPAGTGPGDEAARVDLPAAHINLATSAPAPSDAAQAAPAAAHDAGPSAPLSAEAVAAALRRLDGDGAARHLGLIRGVHDRLSELRNRLAAETGAAPD